MNNEKFAEDFQYIVNHYNNDDNTNEDSINEAFIRLYKKLFNKIRDNGIEIIGRNDDIDKGPITVKSFTDLIKEINRIPAIERNYTNPIFPPENEIVLINPTYGNTVSLSEYNINLAEKVNFYMKLMGYYLALKGVPIPRINEATTLDARIDLIDEIDKVYLTILQISIPNINYEGEDVEIRYSIQGVDGQGIDDEGNINYPLRELTDGTIFVSYKDIELGEEVFIKSEPISPSQAISFQLIGTGYYIFTYQPNSNKYKATCVIRKIEAYDKNLSYIVYHDQNEEDGGISVKKKEEDNNYYLYLPSKLVETEVTDLTHIITNIQVCEKIKDQKEEIIMTLTYDDNYTYTGNVASIEKGLGGIYIDKGKITPQTNFEENTEENITPIVLKFLKIDDITGENPQQSDT